MTKQVFLWILRFTILTFITSQAKASFLAKKIENDTVYKSKQLIVVKLSEHTYQHISFLKTTDFGDVPSNGVVFVSNSEAVIFDTPATNLSTKELINFVKTTLKSKINMVIPTHFHQDCVAGLKTFRKQNIPIKASEKTMAFLKADKNSFVKYMDVFGEKLDLKVGNEKVFIKFLGEGHTKDNIVAYFPTDSVLFGGCLIKELGAKKGNLKDANTAAWSTTVAKVKRTFPHVRIVIPGHGKSGNTDLLDYTETLFK